MTTIVIMTTIVVTRSAWYIWAIGVLASALHRKGWHMAGLLSVNRVTLVGTVGRYGYELRSTATGTSVGHCTLTMSEVGTNGQQYDTFVVCEAWGKVAEGIGEAGPGSVMYIEGALKRKKGRDEGTWETVVNVQKCVVLERAEASRGAQTPGASSSASRSAASSRTTVRTGVATAAADDPDDIPF